MKYKSEKTDHNILREIGRRKRPKERGLSVTKIQL